MQNAILTLKDNGRTPLNAALNAQSDNRIFIPRPLNVFATEQLHILELSKVYPTRPDVLGQYGTYALQVNEGNYNAILDFIGKYSNKFYDSLMNIYGDYISDYEHLLVTYNQIANMEKKLGANSPEYKQKELERRVVAAIMYRRYALELMQDICILQNSSECRKDRATQGAYFNIKPVFKVGGSVDSQSVAQLPILNKRVMAYMTKPANMAPNSMFIGDCHKIAYDIIINNVLTLTKTSEKRLRQHLDASNSLWVANISKFIEYNILIKIWRGEFSMSKYGMVVFSDYQSGYLTALKKAHTTGKKSKAEFMYKEQLKEPFKDYLGEQIELFFRVKEYNRIVSDEQAYIQYLTPEWVIYHIDPAVQYIFKAWADKYDILLMPDSLNKQAIDMGFVV